MVVRPGRNLGFGAGVNRGLAVLAGELRRRMGARLQPRPQRPPGCGRRTGGALEANPAWAMVGPRIFTEAGDVYPSVRRFPSFVDAAGHALLALFKPETASPGATTPAHPRATASSRPAGSRGPASWPGGSALEELGGFDEAYFMYVEDMDLCWRAHQAGWGVGFAGTAGVTHVQGVSTARHPYRMLVAHHRSALRSPCARRRVGAAPPCRWRSWSWAFAWRWRCASGRRRLSHVGEPGWLIAAMAVIVVALLASCWRRRSAVLCRPRSSRAAGDLRPAPDLGGCGGDTRI